MATRWDSNGEVAAAKAPAPWHLWAAGLVGLAWNGFGVIDYLKSNLEGDLHFRQMGMTEAQIAYMEAMPGWLTAVWAVGVWSALIATALLLMRRKLAVPLFLVSLGAYAVSLVHGLLVAPEAVMGGGAAWMQIVVLVGCLLFAGYSWVMARRGVLR
jgi:hypothetical protein